MQKGIENISMQKSAAEQLEYLKKGVAEVIPEGEFRAKLEAAAKSNKPLRVKLGVDPTAPDLHLGHTVVLRKLKHFQDCGHTAIFLIGDFTALVGDPTGQNETRPPLSPDQVAANEKTYLEQVFKILDPKKTEVRRNSEWLSKLTSIDIIRLMSKYRLARMLEHEDFRTRLASQQAISMHEILYPLLVAYDSVMLEADVELGATEQKFNLLMGREIQREYGGILQVAMTMPILVGLDGAKKMSKSLGNYVGITEPPGEMFGKLMSISDQQMWSYYELLTDLAPAEIGALRDRVERGETHPMDAKLSLAETVTAGFHSAVAAREARKEWRRIFSRRETPTDVRVVEIPRGPARRLSKLLVELNLAPSNAEAQRLMQQGGVEVDGARADDVKQDLDTTSPREFLLRAGKKNFLRIRVI